jgi:NADPH:quinone reductase-like Zn-dependent oxidoreductase
VKAIVWTKHGPPNALQLQEVEKPTSVDDEVPATVHAAATNAADWLMLIGKAVLLCIFTGFRGPRNPKFGPGFAWESFLLQGRSCVS